MGEIGPVNRNVTISVDSQNICVFYFLFRGREMLCEGVARDFWNASK